MVLESQDAIQSIEQIFREDAIRVEKMVNLVEKDITEQPEDIMQIDQEEILGNKESKDKQHMINSPSHNTTFSKKELARSVFWSKT